MSVTIATTGNTTTLKAPFHPQLPGRARDLGGDFNKPAGMWVFDARDEPRVRQLARELFGTDGTDTRTVSIKIKLDDWAGDLGRQRGGETLWLAGRKVAGRRGRDERVQLGEKVIVVEGGFDSRGGSVANPRLDPHPGTVLEIRDVPAGHADLQDRRVTVLDDQAQPDVEALRAERERLLARLAEIDAQIGGAAAA